jgi:thioesterase domain-containing protein
VSVAAFLGELRSRDIRIWSEGDQLRCSAPAGALTPELREHLRHRKSEIVEFLSAAEMAARQQRAIVPLQPRGGRVPVFAIGGHNGDVFCYRAFARHLGDDQPFFGLQPPGLDGRNAPLTSIEELAGYFAKQIREFQPHLPCIIAGYCAGGTIAFELARQLLAQGTPIHFVALFAGQYPTWYRPLSQRRLHLIEMLQRVRVHSRSLASLSNAGRRAYLADMLRRNTAPRPDPAGNSAPDPVLVYRDKVKSATMLGICRHRPRYFDGRARLFLPNRGWLHSATAVRRWRPLAKDIKEYIGPDGCPAETMLLEPHAGAIAELFRRSGDEHHAHVMAAAS